MTTNRKIYKWVNSGKIMKYRIDRTGETLGFIAETREEEVALEGMYDALNDLDMFGERPRIAQMASTHPQITKRCSELTFRVYYSPHEQSE